jgi:dihydropteroate synthase
MRPFDHAAYLGSELQKAYIAIKKKKEYVQDGEII